MDNNVETLEINLHIWDALDLYLRNICETWPINDYYLVLNVL
jgi:hypothetical protein